MSQTSQSFMSRWTPAEVMLAILFLVAPLYYHANPGGDGLKIPHSPWVWAMALLFVTYSLGKAIKHNEFRIPRYFSYVIAFPLFATLAGFIASMQSPLEWLFRFMFIWGGLLFFFGLFQERMSQGRIDKLLYILLIAGMIHSFLGCLQIWFKTDLPFLKSPKGIPSGFFQQVNIEATILVTILVLAFYLLSRPILSKSKWYWSIPVFLTIASSTYVVVASGSRIGALGLLLAFPIMLIARKKQLFFSRTLVLVALSALLIGGIGASFNGADRVLEKTTAMQSGFSKDARFGIYKISLDLVKERPLVGHGIGTFPFEFQMARPEFFSDNNEAILPSQMVSHPHNEMLLWLVESGLVAFVGLMIFVIGTLLAIKSNGWSRGGAYLALLLPLALHLQVEVPFYVSALPWFVFLLLLSLPFRRYQKSTFNVMSASAQKLTMMALSVVMLIMFIFLSHTVFANWDFNKFMHADRDPERHKMTFALNNPYMSSFAYEVEAATYLKTALAVGNRDYLNLYSKWAQEKVTIQPSPLLYRNLVLSQLGLGKNEDACNNYRLAKSIYPRSGYLETKPDVCE